MELTGIVDPAERLAFIERALQRSSLRGVARKTPKARTAATALTSVAPVSAPVARSKAVKQTTPLTVADLTAHEREQIETAFHEAGHAVAAVALGGEIFSAVVAPGRVGGVTGLTTMRTMPVRERTAEIAFAGAWSQARWRTGRRPLQREMWAVLETTGCRDYREHLVGESGVATRAQPLLERCWPAIVKVAQKLLRDNEVRHEDVCRALGLSDAGGTGSLELALIRSGQAPGTFTVTPPVLEVLGV